MPKPQTVLCYICGREFGSYSINVHERQCAKRWEKQRNKEKEAEKSEQKRKISTPKDKLRDPWVRRDGPSIKANSKYSKSMNDIRLSNGGTHVTEIEREILHDARPSTVILKDRDDVNGDLSAEEIELNAKGDVSPEVPKLSRPGTAVLNKKYSSPILPSRVNPVLLMKAKDDENEEHAEKERNLEKDYNSLTEPSIVSLRKHSAPESISVRVSNSSPASSVSSHSSVDSQETPMRVTEGMPRFRSTKNPNLLVCYICGNEFGSKSLKIHEPQCLKKWKLANPRYYSRKGTHGGMFKADSTNAIHHKENFIKASNGSLTKGVTKKGTFKSASCENLLDACSGTLKPTNSLQALKELSKSHNRLYTPSKKPTMEPCYICGKEIIKHSLAVHEKQCKKKWDALKEKNEKDDKKLSAASGLPSKRHSVNYPITIKVDKTEDVENNNLDKSKSQEQISEPEGEKKESTSKVHKERKPSTVTCYICGRAYGTASISIHEKQCQKKWEAETARKEALLRPKSAKKKTKPRPSSFVL